MTPFGLWTYFPYATNMGQHHLLHRIPSIVIAFISRTYISGLHLQQIVKPYMLLFLTYQQVVFSSVPTLLNF